MRYIVIVIMSVFLAAAAAAGISAVSPDVAEAAGGRVAKCGGGKILLNAKEKRSFVLHNNVRRNNNLRPFCVHPKLQKAARAHSKDMIARDYFSHYTKGRNEGPGQRIRRYGYNWQICAENIAGGSGNRGAPGPIFRGWMNSDAHRRNILNGKLYQIGIGTYTGNYKGTSGYTMYTADFGNPR